MAKSKAEKSKAEKDIAQELEIPDSLITIDEETGKVCIGGKCMNVQYEPQTDDIVIEVAPNTKQCSPLMRRVVNSFAQAMTDEKTRMKFRSRRVGSSKD
jgi:hypothetical protein